MTFAPPASALPAEPPSRNRYDVVIVGGAIQPVLPRESPSPNR